MRHLVAAIGLAFCAVSVGGCGSSGAFAPAERKAFWEGGEGGSEAEAPAQDHNGNLAGREAAIPDLPEDGVSASRRGGQTVPIDDEGPPVGGERERPGETAVEPGRSAPLLIYTARLNLAVYQVQATQKKVIALGKALGGFLARQDGRTVVIRVPARRFEAALDRIEGFGDVIRRQIEAQDVTEEFRDQTIRLRNLEAVRARLETLLAKADKVKDALEVQRELARITGEIESLKGRLRFLEDRIAFSTISVDFQARPRNDAASAAPAAFHLPFPWIEELGLRSLMDVR